MRRSPVRGRLFRYLVSLVPALVGLCFAAGAAHAALGDYLYGWGAPYQFYAPTGIAAGADGRVYVADQGNPVFNAAGDLLQRLKVPGVSYCSDVAVAPDGRVYGINGAGGVIAIFEADGSYLKSFGSEGSGDGQFQWPTSIAVNAAGEVHVGDAWNHTVQVFDRDGNFLRRWSTPGRPIGIDFDAAGNVYVGDYYSTAIRAYTPSGTQFDIWGVYSGLARINGLAIDRAARELYVMGESRREVQVFSLDGAGWYRQPVRVWHGADSGVGMLVGREKDLALGPDGKVYVAEGHPYGNDFSRIKVYDRFGAFLAVWQARGDAEGRFAFPVSVTRDFSGDVLVADNGNRRVQRFRPDGTFAGAFPVEPDCEALEMGSGDDGRIYLAQFCPNEYADGSATFISSYTPDGAAASRWRIPQVWQTGLAAVGGRVFVAVGGQVLIYGTDGTSLGAFSSTAGVRWDYSTADPTRNNPYWYAPYLRSAMDVEVGADGLLYVLDAGTDVVAFDLSGTARRWIPFVSPVWVPPYRSIALDTCGDLFAHWHAYEEYPRSSSVAAFDRNGVLLRSWGSFGIEAGQFRGAFGIAADDAGRVFVVDRDNQRVQVFEGLTACGAPVAAAGADRTGHPGAVLTLDGSASTDPSGQALSYAWRLVAAPAGSTAALAGAATATPALVPDLLGDYVAELVVSNASGRTSQPDQVVVSAVNQPPTADAGPDQPVTAIGTAVALAGAGFDADGDPLTLAWEFLARPAGSAAALSDAASAGPTFVADRNGDYLLRLTVSDAWGGSASDTVLVSFVNVPPVADAGRAQSVLQGTVVQLDGSASADANGDALSFSWQLVQAPPGSAAVLSGADGAFPTFVAEVPGQYAITLVVSDGIVESAAALVTVTAVSYQSALTDSLAQMLALDNSFPDLAFAGKNMRDTLANKINSVIAKVESGNYAGALAQMQNDLLPKMDGCALGGDDATSDWITGCDEQSEIYPLALRIIDLLGQFNS